MNITDCQNSRCDCRIMRSAKSSSSQNQNSKSKMGTREREINGLNLVGRKQKNQCLCTVCELCASLSFPEARSSLGFERAEDGELAFVRSLAIPTLQEPHDRCLFIN